MKNTLFNLLLFLLLLTTPVINFAQAPPLGRVASFALFTTTGSITNSGTSVITGDIGTNMGSITGFPPGVVIGSTYVADSVTSLAATNLATASASLAALTCDTTIGAAMGNGQILTPKVYCINSVGSISGNLTFNAMGNPNAIFVVKVNGALSTGISTKILLINSANLNNIYWRVNGVFTLGDSSLFKGTLIAAGAINLLNKSSITGRGLTTAGAITLQSSNNALPVNLISFTANCNKKNTVFQWATASEKNNHYFTLEMSSDQTNWKTLTNIDGAGTSNMVNTYAFMYMNELSEIKYYRLKQTDLDGKYTYSDMVVVKPCEEDKIVVGLYPNPATGEVSITFKRDLNQTGSVTVYDMLGTKVYFTDEIPSSIDLSSQPNGIYFMHLNTNGENVIERIMINHF